MRIEPGAKTDEPIRTRGWTYWHHLFGARALLLGALFATKTKDGSPAIRLLVAKLLDWSNKLCRYGTGAARESMSQLFYDQALNPLANYAIRPSWGLLGLLEEEP